ncbi:MAG: hypothetical protein KTR30_20460 [Saprospiraceae bacterium]|nr:hypothetical protein [Saprospiraceae bacterium]
MKIKEMGLCLAMALVVVVSSAFTSGNSIFPNQEENTMMNQDKKIGYILLLDEEAFPKLKENAWKPSGGERPTNSSESYEDFVKKELTAWAKKHLDIKPKEVTQSYSGMMLGFAVSIPIEKKDEFLKKAKALKEITTIEEDGVMGIEGEG